MLDIHGLAAPGCGKLEIPPLAIGARFYVGVVKAGDRFFQLFDRGALELGRSHTVEAFGIVISPELYYW